MKTIIKKYYQPGQWIINIPFDKEGMEQDWVGIVDAREAGEYKLDVITDHTAAKTKGRITVRAVVGAGASVAIKGIICIAKAAQETDDFLELRVLTLDKTSRATAEPELEIEANNVKASHAASVGPIDGEQVLYLKSRGLSKNEAEKQIVDGWLGVK